jgi:hypothetical protein
MGLEFTGVLMVVLGELVDGIVGGGRSGVNGTRGLGVGSCSVTIGLVDSSGVEGMSGL